MLALFMGACGVSHAAPFYKESVKQSMRRVADWQIAHYDRSIYGDGNWVNATFHLGLTEWAAIAEQADGDNTYYNWLLRLGNRNYWQVEKRMYHADDICIAQTYLALYEKYNRKEMMIPSQARAEWVIAHPSSGSYQLDYGKGSTLEHWTWCDALFMAPPVYAKLYVLTGDKKYLRFMDKEYRATYDYLFDKADTLFYRDHRYFTMKEANGAKVFWGRGNGWVLGGLVQLLNILPEKNKSRAFYQDLFVKMCYRIAPLQGKDGFWHASLLDPASYPSPETSCSGFFVYALAYGVNKGLLPADEFMPVIERGWKALLSAVEEDGKLGYVQPIGADPKKVTRQMTEVYGPGAFLLAGTEIYRMASDALVPTKNISAERVRQIAAMLPDKPKGMGVTYKDRAVWNKLKETREARNLLEDVAPALLRGGMPPFVDSLYLDLLKTNYRVPGEVMLKSRFQYLFNLTLAECLENKRRYIKAIENALVQLCDQKPWSNPAHDMKLNNYNGTDYYVDLVVATAGNGIAQCVTMLDDRLSPEVKARVNCAFREKVFRPIYRCLEESKPFWWFTSTNNWNSVCLAGVTGIALAMLPDKLERAYFVAAAEKYNGYGMAGYASDGYCSEGVGYYNYGFGAYILLREEVCRATNGEIDFFANPKFVRVARYGKDIQMADGVCPAYSDGRVGVTPNSNIVDYCSRVLGQNDSAETYRFVSSGNMSLSLLWMFPHQAWPLKQTDGIRNEMAAQSDPLRAYFKDAGIFVARPAEGSSCALSFSAKGGSNAENHNHNDVGSYDVAIGDVLMAGDQGGPFSYPGDYFNAGAPAKYAIKGSFGHPVPLVNGKQQATGRAAKATVTDLHFSVDEDVFGIDYASAYPDSGIDKLKRTFAYNRSGEGKVVVEDTFSSKESITFETALTTRADWKQIDDNHLLLNLKGKQMVVAVEASDKVIFSSCTVEVNAPAYTRIGIALKRPAKQGFVRLIMTPQ